MSFLRIGLDASISWLILSSLGVLGLDMVIDDLEMDERLTLVQVMGFNNKMKIKLMEVQILGDGVGLAWLWFSSLDFHLSLLVAWLRFEGESGKILFCCKEHNVPKWPYGGKQRSFCRGLPIALLVRNKKILSASKETKHIFHSLFFTLFILCYIFTYY